QERGAVGGLLGVRRPIPRYAAPAPRRKTLRGKRFTNSTIEHKIQKRLTQPRLESPMSEPAALDDPLRTPPENPDEPPRAAFRWASLPSAIRRFMPQSWAQLITITIAIVSLAISLITSQSQTQRQLRQQLTDTLDRRMAITLEIQKLNVERLTATDPQLASALQNDLGILGAQDYALIAHAADIARQIPDEVEWMDYSILANGFALAGDLENAERYYLETIGAVPSDFAEQWARNGYAWFLYSQPARIEDGRAQYEAIITLINRI